MTELVAALLRCSDHRVEVIAVDDGSTDGVGDALRSLRHARLSVLRNEPNAGVAAARNTGARRARGSHLLFVDSDDRVPDDAIDAWLGVLDPACRLAFGHASAPDLGGTIVRRSPRPLGPVFNDLHGLFLAGTFVVRRDLFGRAGGYDESLRFSENTELGIRLSDQVIDRAHDVRTLDRTVLLITPRADRAIEYADAQLHALTRILEVHGPRLRLDASLEADYRAVAGVAALRLGRASEGRRHLALSFRLRPTVRSAGRWAASVFPAPLRPWRPRTSRRRSRSS